MLKINNIDVFYKDVIFVLKGVSLEVQDTAVVALLGSNGAGKSTTLKAISGLLKPEEGKVTSGNIEFDGRRIENLMPEEIARLGILQVMEGRRVFPQLTTEENLKASTSTARRGFAASTLLGRVYHYLPRLKELRHSVAGYLSGGEQQMLVIGRALMANAKLMLLDEPSLGLSPLLVRHIFDIIKRLNEEEKLSILLVEQNVKLALSLTTYGYIMENGKIVLDGPADKLRENEDVKEFYFGLKQSGARRNYREVKHYKRRKRWLG